LPKTTKISSSKAIELLMDLAAKREKEEYPWLSLIECPEFDRNEECRNLFSVDDEKVTEAVYRILEDLGIQAIGTAKFAHPGMTVQTLSTKGRVETQSTEINKIANFIEKQRSKRKTVVVANTYKELPPTERTNKQHLDPAMKLFFETNNTVFLTTLSLYNLWKKVASSQISVHEASSLIQTQNGEIQI